METDDEPKKDFKALDADDIALLKAYVRVISVAIFLLDHSSFCYPAELTLVRCRVLGRTRSRLRQLMMTSRLSLAESKN
jgi:hypothetical protein